MATFDNRYDPIRLLWRRIGLFVLFILVCAAIPGLWNVFTKERESRELRVQAELQAQHLQAQESQLHDDISMLETNKGKEAALRGQYAVGKRGEGLIIIVEPKTPEPIEATTTVIGKWVHKFLPFW